uniref:hypothetical protein n=1 Tax=Mastigocoleus sp. MO_188.B34 TaxID=3036635 RepID=UPI0026331931
DEPKEILLARFQAIKEYLESKRQIKADRIIMVNGDTSRFNAVLRLTTKSSNQTFVAQYFDNPENNL